jgi:hydroxyacylglutathione hydrolase
MGALHVTSIVDEGLGNASHLVDLGGGAGLIVDPPRDVRRIVERARERDLSIRFAADTHLHNDFVSGNLQLAELEASILVPRAAGAEFEHVAVDDGSEVDLGTAVLRVVATPGHTPEHVSYVLSVDGTPRLLFGGGALLRGSVARTDLLGAAEARPLALSLYASLHERLLALPDDVVVYPTHGARASFCTVGAPADGEVSTTIGRERRDNDLLQLPSREAFADRLLDDPPPIPAYFRAVRELNRRPRAVYPLDRVEVPSLDAEGLAAAERDGAVVVDVRDVRSFGAGHVPGSLSIELRPAFATWLGWLVQYGRPLVFVADDGQDLGDLVWQCRTIGFERIIGRLAGGMSAWSRDGRPVARVEELGDAVPTPATFVDVRHATEYREWHLAGARNVPLGELEASVATLPGGPLVLYCAHGQRSTTAASILERAGRRDVRVLVGAPDEWAARTGVEPEVAEASSVSPGVRT